MTRKQLFNYSKDNSTIALNFLYTKEMEIYPAYILKYNSHREKKITLLMIPNEKGWHYLAVKTVCITKRNK